MQVWTRFMQAHSLDASVRDCLGCLLLLCFVGHLRLSHAQPALFNRTPMDLLKLFRTVMRAGGYEGVLRDKGWVSGALWDRPCGRLPHAEPLL
jgi:hypothetical protein